MAALQSLRACSSNKDLAKLLGYKYSNFMFIVYGLKGSSRYKQKSILKKSGGIRNLNIPLPKLMGVQRNLAHILQECEQEIAGLENTNQVTRVSRPRSVSHGFKKNHSIATNAHPHKNKKYVFNVDIENFFPSINFGRVRGYFSKDKYFQLNISVATTVAQIACHNNELPQGSPTSPIISNLIGRIMDFKLVNLARENKCYYTRYADDLTFSTGIDNFPSEIAEKVRENGSEIWVPGSILIAAIGRSGFSLHSAKTRMQVRPSRQTVTGLVVNKNVNVPKELYKAARSMSFRLFMDGAYEFPYISKSARAIGSTPKVISDIRPIESLLGYIHFVKDFDRPQRRQIVEENTAKPGKNNRDRIPSINNLRANLLFFKYFVSNPKPTIICEGKTDNLYLKFAIAQSKNFHNSFRKQSASGKTESAVHFLRYSRPIIELLRLKGGSGDIKNFISEYENWVENYKHKPLKNPVIIVIDNDTGAKDIIPMLKNKFKIDIGYKTTEEFYYLTKNLYLIKTLEAGSATGHSAIEDCFAKSVTDTKVSGKSLCLVESEFNNEIHYGKEIFSQAVVRANYNKIDFSGFGYLLGRIEAAMVDYQKRQHHP